MVSERTPKTEFHHFTNLPNMDYILKEVSLFAAGCQHNEFGECIAVQISVGLQLYRCCGDAQNVGNTTIGEELSQHTISLTRIQVRLVNQHLRKSQLLKCGSHCFYAADCGVGYLRYFLAPE